MRSIKLTPAILLLSMLLNLGCSEPPTKKDLLGRWLHRTERRGLDFSDVGVVCWYSLSPQRIDLFSYDIVDGDTLQLNPLRNTTAEPKSYPFSISGETILVQTDPPGFQSYVKVKKKDEKDHPWPALVGLWQADGSFTDDILVFTRRGTVFGQSRLKSEEQVSMLWARYELYRDRSSDSENRKKVGLWGLHGETALSGKKRKISFEGEYLRFEGRKYIRRADSSKLAK